jgi:hypothetical protein
MLELERGTITGRTLLWAGVDGSSAREAGGWQGSLRTRLMRALYSAIPAATSEFGTEGTFHLRLPMSAHWARPDGVADLPLPPGLTPSGHCPADGLLAQLPATWLYGEGRGKLSRTYPGGQPWPRSA